MQVITLAGRMVAARSYDQVSTAFTWGKTTRKPISAKENDSPALPDIYYIIPDGYPSDASLQSAMNFDNSGVHRRLERTRIRYRRSCAEQLWLLIALPRLHLEYALL